MRHLLFFFCSVLLAATAHSQTERQTLPTSPLKIVDEDQVIDLIVELADEPRELATGMMFRDGVPEGTGMLFNFGVPREANMYMRNVSFTLDMIFFDPEGEVLAIIANAQPFSERILNPGIAVKGVLELAGGEAQRLGIEPGDMIEHSMFESVAQ